VSPTRKIFADAASAATTCARYILPLLEQAAAARGSAAFAISGGTTPAILFDSLAASTFSWDRVHIFWVDERCVPPADDSSNYKLAREHLIVPAGIRDANVHRIHGEADPAEAAARYSDEIRRFFGLGPGELPCFDVIHRGMGPDGHTASLFPGDPLVHDRTGIAAPTYAAKFNQWRVTLLPGVLAAAKNTALLVTGADKAEALSALERGPLDPLKYPAQIAAEQAVWFLDKAAAQTTTP
jgi:6-phosphogluconolactonase